MSNRAKNAAVGVFVAALLVLLAWAISAMSNSASTRNNNPENGHSVSVTPSGMLAMSPTTTNVQNTPRTPRLFLLQDCEDILRSEDITRESPCATWDDTEWRIVYGYQPYTHIPMRACLSSTNIGEHYPCLVFVGNDEYENPHHVYARDVTHYSFHVFADTDSLASLITTNNHHRYN